MNKTARGGSGAGTTLKPGDLLALTIEKPVPGGRMIARHDGQVVLVAGAIPGERVEARIERVEKRLAFAAMTMVLEPSGDRRERSFDHACGGCGYAHIAYERQLALKGEVIADAFARIGRTALPGPVSVTASPEQGYRMRARLHVEERRAGFFREGTHQLCDPGPTGQLSEGALAAVPAMLAALGSSAGAVVAIEVSENIAGSERAMHLELRSADALPPETLAAGVAAAGLTGCSARSASGAFSQSGDPVVSDPLPLLTGGRASSGTLGRHAASFFQGNRYLLPALTLHVIDAVPAAGAVLDLYAGVGLFSVSLAAAGRSGVSAVEGDRESGADLLRNARPYAERLQPVVGLVEDYVRRDRTRPETVMLDPPRTGISREAMDALPRLAAARIIYVSCDPPTLARDARRLLDAGYALTSLRGFDLFPGTPHVETAAVFDRAG